MGARDNEPLRLRKIDAIQRGATAVA
jgi:hypothetical protein